MAREGTLQALQRAARPLSGDVADYDELIWRASASRVVLIGEATHGTQEFYKERAALTRRLIEDHGFCCVAIEGDWPDAHRVHRFVQGQVDEDGDTRPADALQGFRRFPGWMWRNTEVRDFVGWLRRQASTRRDQETTLGFFGLDLYSLYASAEAVIRYLDRVDPEAAERARYRYGCFEDFGEDSQAYGYATSFDLERSCEDLVVAQLQEMRCRYAASMAPCRRGDLPSTNAPDELFFAERNAEVVRNAEEYYRTMFRGRVSSWNLRDEHMMQTLEALLEHMDHRLGGRSKVVVWAHNSHVGDARATELGAQGEWNLGQLARQRLGAECYSVGFSTHTGTVTAASRWDGVAERKRVRPSRSDSYEGLFHELVVASGWTRFLLFPPDAKSDAALAGALGGSRLQRAIGVIYRPDSERVSHYFEATLSRQFDALIHIDETRALEPLDRPSAWHGGEVPETFPSAL